MCQLISFSVEKGADDLIAKLLDINAKAKKTEELLDAIEKERYKSLITRHCTCKRYDAMY